MGLGSNDSFVTDAPWLNLGHDFGLDSSSVGHPRSNSIGLVVYEGMSTLSGASVLYIHSSGQCQPCRKGFNILGRPYGI
jgi:hypothetical protein